jgi:hypothetical protein
MTKQRPYYSADDFKGEPDVFYRPTEDESWKRIESDPDREILPRFFEKRPAVDIRKKPSIFVRLRPWLPALPVPVALAVISWFLGGNVVWCVSAVIMTALLIIVGAVAHPRVNYLGPRVYLMSGYLVACWASWVLVGWYWPVTTVLVRAEFGDELKQDTSAPLRISYAGRVELEQDRCRRCSFQFRGPFQPAELKIEMLTPYGWVQRPFKTCGTEVRLTTFPHSRLYVDNRGHGATTLVCGKLNFRIAAGCHECLRIPNLPKDVHYPLAIDGTVVGTFEGGDLLIDTLGTRAYLLRRVYYVDYRDRDKVAGGLLVAPPEVLFAGAHVHKVAERIDFFLEPAPQTIKVLAIGNVPMENGTRTELREWQP